MKQANLKAITLAACIGAATAGALAGPVKVEAVLAPKEQIRLDFAGGSKQFFLLTKREGKAAGSAPLAGAAVTEYGRHDIVPGASGDAGGYLVFTAPDGDVAYLKWLVRAVFVPGPGGKPALLDNGVWEVVAGTGKFKELKGAGRLNIKPVSATDRNYILEGELAGGSMP
jgi:hypothetical protein